MWKKSVLAAVTELVLGLPVLAYGGEYDDFEDAHPLRIVAYPLHAIGYGLERLITRPIHRLVSRPGLAPIVGHTPDEFSFDQRPSSLLSSDSMRALRDSPVSLSGTDQPEVAEQSAQALVGSPLQ